MNGTMSKEQRAYAKALAVVKVFRDEEQGKEAAFCNMHDYRDESGELAQCLYCIADEAAFDVANEQFCMQEEEFYTRYRMAEKNLRIAEDHLISWGLGLMPKAYADERATLEKAAKQNYSTRQKLVEYTFKLDSSTIPKK